MLQSQQLFWLKFEHGWPCHFTTCRSNWASTVKWPSRASKYHSRMSYRYLPAWAILSKLQCVKSACHAWYYKHWLIFSLQVHLWSLRCETISGWVCVLPGGPKRGSWDGWSWHQVHNNASRVPQHCTRPVGPLSSLQELRCSVWTCRAARSTKQVKFDLKCSISGCPEFQWNPCVCDVEHL